jgi:hypothetical protein
MLGVEDHNARQLMTVPGIGPLIANAVVAALAYVQPAHRMKDHASRSTTCIGCIEPGSARESVHSPPIRAPFSATERFINKTTNVAASITTANSQKQSKYASADAC